MPTLRPRKSTQEDEVEVEQRKTRKRPTATAARRVTRRTVVASEVSTESDDDENLLAQMEQDFSSSPVKKTRRVNNRRRASKKIKVDDKDDAEMEVEDDEKENDNNQVQVEKDNILDDIGNLTATTGTGGQQEEELLLTVSSSPGLLPNKKGEKKDIEILNAGGEGLDRNFQETRRLGEEFAVEFLTNSTNHPVISCFRELKGTDIGHLIDTQKMRKLMGVVPLSVVYMGLIDYMAVTIDNPLYVDESSVLKKPIKNIPAKVTKIMNEFKSTLISWGVSDYPAWKERYSTTMSFLKAQTSRFNGLQFDEAFAGILTSIESEICRSKQKYDFMTSAKKIVEVDSDPVEVITLEKESDSSSKIYSSPTKTPLEKSSVGNLINTPIPKSERPEFTCGPTKKLRLELAEERENKNSGTSDSDVSISVTVKKPQVNAFALLMSRSKEIAEQKKQKKLLATPPPRMISH